MLLHIHVSDMELQLCRQYLIHNNNMWRFDRTLHHRVIYIWRGMILMFQIGIIFTQSCYIRQKRQI